jgi:hypothetical protein
VKVLGDLAPVQDFIFAAYGLRANLPKVRSVSNAVSGAGKLMHTVAKLDAQKCHDFTRFRRQKARQSDC